MCLRNTQTSYGHISKFLHWLIAIAVILMLIAGVSFDYLPKGEFRSSLIYLHKSTGITLLGLMILRLLWRWTNQNPKLPEGSSRLEHAAAWLIQYLFYLTVIAIPITGIIMTIAASHPLPFWWISNISLPFIPANKDLSHQMFAWHGYLAWTITGLIVLHTLAGLKHHFINKDDVLKRMMPQKRMR